MFLQLSVLWDAVKLYQDSPFPVWQQVADHVNKWLAENRQAGFTTVSAKRCMRRYSDLLAALRKENEAPWTPAEVQQLALLFYCCNRMLVCRWKNYWSL